MPRGISYSPPGKIDVAGNNNKNMLVLPAQRVYKSFKFGNWIREKSVINNYWVNGIGITYTLAAVCVICPAAGNNPPPSKFLEQ
jgi:hypothetical protein